MRNFYLLFGAVAVVGLGLLGYNLLSPGTDAIVTEPVELEGIEDSQGLVGMAQGITIGDEDAPVTIVEFSDFECPGCAAFARLTKPQIDAELIETGRAKFVFYDYPLMHLHPSAFLAARAARCANDQDRFWAYHDVLYEDQARWARHQNPQRAFEEVADEVGLEAGTFSSCLASDAHADVVTANLRLAEELRLPGTPMILISTGGPEAQAAPGLDFETIMKTIEEMTAEGGAEAEAGG